MFSSGGWVVRIAGVDVRFDTSWALIALLVAWGFADRYTSGVSGHPVGVALVMALAATVLFLGSVLAHELAHAMEARHRGIGVGGITLYLFGGATQTTSEPRTPGDEFALTAVGPYTSIVLAAALGLVAYAAHGLGLDEVAEVTGMVAWLDFALGVLNLLPGAPLDGGRILEAAVWRVTGDRRRAKLVAARAGKLLAALALAFGLRQMFFVPGALVSGLWFIFIGWFLLQAAGAEQAQVELQQTLEGTPARVLLSAEADVVGADTSLAWVIEAHFRRHHVDAVLVEQEGHTVGVLRLEDARAVPPEQRWPTLVSQVMRPLDGLPLVSADAEANEVLRLLPRKQIVGVSEDGRVIGLVTPRQLMAALERLQLLNRGQRPRGGRRPEQQRIDQGMEQ